MPHLTPAQKARVLRSVQAGATLERIATRYGLTMEQATEAHAEAIAQLVTMNTATGPRLIRRERLHDLCVYFMSGYVGAEVAEIATKAGLSNADVKRAIAREAQASRMPRDPRRLDDWDTDVWWFVAGRVVELGWATEEDAAL